jgi:hypothetical protein
MRRILAALAFTSLAAALFAAPAAHAKGSKPEDVFGGSIKLSDKSFPTEAKSSSAYISAVKKQVKDRFQEDTEKKRWMIFYAAFFKKPVNNLEITVKFYDVTDGGNRLVESYEQYLTERNQRVVIGVLKLKKWEGSYDPNSKILMTMESNGKTIAQASFYLIGEGKKYKGKVEFTDEETKEGGTTDDQ